ncbi:MULTISPECIES: hypothetical protein [unclassified Paraflavitalea]|uniref:hypothetical protein n=1 Tax=unclassified Paraflavitalea TaxID=2798305 RepID=UPI003D348BE0
MSSKDPGFIFYPGDYLRDTQCLSEKVQVAYDRIMCEHMRNICISHAQYNFFTKKLSKEEKKELRTVLSENESGFFIEWVVASISKRKAYSESRRNNRTSKKREDMKHISESYDSHMEIEIDNENKSVLKGVQGERDLPLTDVEIGATKEFVFLTMRRNLSTDRVNEYWKSFLIISKDEFYNSRSKQLVHFRNWLKKQPNELDQQSVTKNTIGKKSGGFAIISEALGSLNEGGSHDS